MKAPATFVAFSVDGPPLGKQRGRAMVRDGKTSVRTPAKTRHYEKRAAQIAAWNAKGRRFEGPVSVRIIAYRARPKTPGPKHESRSGLTAKDGSRFCTTTPDADNIGKAILDSINHAKIWTDDAQVSDLQISKRWAHAGELPRVDVEIRTLTPEPTP
jgi:Holliday junction resolvase RusA-like endonuclease